MYSLKKQLQRNLLITVALSLVALLFVLYIGIAQLTTSYISARLQDDADSIISALSQNTEGIWQLAPERMSTVYNRVLSGHYYAVSIDKHIIRSRSLFDRAVNIKLLEQGQTRCQESAANEFTCLYAITKNGTAVTIWLAEDITNLKQSQYQFILFAIMLVIATIALLLLIQYRVLHHGFARFDQIRSTIRKMQLADSQESNGNTFTALTQLPSEIQPLVDEIERLLNQLRQRVQRSRNMLGNLAHELKRPLQRYRLQLEKLSNQQRQEGEEIAGDINNIVERELRRARIIGVATPGRFIAIDRDLLYLVTIINNLHPRKNISTSYPKNLVLPYDRDDMLELLGNLIDNAAKFAKSDVSLSFVAQHAKTIYKLAGYSASVMMARD